MYFRIKILVIIVFLSSACKFKNKEEILSLFRFKQSSEQKLFDAYQNFIDTSNSSDFPLSSFRVNPDWGRNSQYKQKFCSETDLCYFPATLWQAYSINGLSDWKNYAQNFGELLKQNEPTDTLNPEVRQNVLLTAYLISKEEEYASLIVNDLPEYVSFLNKRIEKDSNIVFNSTFNVGRLLENQVMFFASKTTGDPFYSKFAIENSNFIFDNYFKNNQANEILSRFIGYSRNLAGNDKQQRPSSKEYADLAVNLYSYTFLFSETGMDKYQKLSDTIASVFAISFNQIEDNISGDLKGCINSEMDLLSQALVCNALYDLGNQPGKNYRETSLLLYYHILDSLNTSLNTNIKPSFKLFYYLFEYERRKQHLTATA
jgi:hypothetical protein